MIGQIPINAKKIIHNSHLYFRFVDMPLDYNDAFRNHTKHNSGSKESSIHFQWPGLM